MKLSLTQENLAKALNIVGRIVSTRGSLPVLSNVLISTDSNRLKLSATNLEIGVNCWIGCKVEQEGSVTVPARLLSEFITSLPAGNINLSAAETNLSIKTPHYESNINGIPADEFPLIPEIKGKPLISLPADVFKEAVSQVVIAASADENRPALAGVNIYNEEDQLVLAATDSYRLAERKIKLSKKTEQKISVIVPVRTMQEVVRILGETSGDITINLDENQIMFKIGDIELVSRLIEGQFPNYRQIIPEKVETTVTIDTPEFTRIAKVAGLFARENAGSIMIEIQAEGRISVRSSTAQVGENTSFADCEVTGDDGEISLNGRYLSEVLGVVKSEKVNFSMSGKLNPCLIQPEDGTDEYLHIIMPLRT